jgi:hypothetical protein
MNTVLRARRHALGALLGGATGLAALASGCATGSARPVQRGAAPPADVRVGDRWRYAVINLYNNTRLTELVVEVTELAPRLRLSVVDAAGGTRPPEVYARAWQVLEEPNYDLPQLFASAAPLLPATLAPGASERFSGSYTTPMSADRLYWSEIARVRGWDRVRVPAGEFEALRVQRTIAFQHADRFRQRENRTDTLWYAPEVNRWVRREWTGSYGTQATLHNSMREDWVAHELIEYRRGLERSVNRP